MMIILAFTLAAALAAIPVAAQEAAETSASTTATHSAPRQDEGQIISATCKATITHNGVKQAISTTPINVAIGDRLTCDGDDGEIKIKFQHNYDVTIGVNSDLVIDEFITKPKGNNILIQGLSFVSGYVRVTFHPEQVPGTPEYDKLWVDTLVATIGVRGTEFTVDDRAGKDKITVRVLKGKVRVQSKVTKAEAFVRTGYQITIDKKGLSALTPARGLYLKPKSDK